MMAMRAPAKRARRRAPAPTSSGGFRLPVQAAPVIRNAANNPFRLDVVLSELACQQCFDACRLRGGPFQSVCEALCATLCNGQGTVSPMSHQGGVS